MEEKRSFHGIQATIPLTIIRAGLIRLLDFNSPGVRSRALPSRERRHENPRSAFGHFYPCRCHNRLHWLSSQRSKPHRYRRGFRKGWDFLLCKLTYSLRRPNQTTQDSDHFHIHVAKLNSPT